MLQDELYFRIITCFHNPDGERLLSGTNWTFQCFRIIFVFKGPILKAAAERYNDLPTDWTFRGLNPARGMRLFPTKCRRALRPIQPPIQWLPGFSSAGTVGHFLRAVPKLWMSGAKPLFPYMPSESVHMYAVNLRFQLYEGIRIETKGRYTLSVKLSDFNEWCHNWRKNRVNCAVFKAIAQASELPFPVFFHTQNCAVHSGNRTVSSVYVFIHHCRTNKKNWLENWQTWCETCAVPENIQFRYSCSFFYTVKLHSFRLYGVL